MRTDTKNCNSRPRPPCLIERFRELWEKGLKSEEIARELGISEEVVPWYAAAAGLLPIKPSKARQRSKVAPQTLVYMRDMWLDGATIREIAEFFELDPSTVSKYMRMMGLRRRKKRVRREKITREVLAALCEEGYTDREIAERFGVTPQYIGALRRRYGIYKRGPRGTGHLRYVEKVADAIMGEIERKCFTTNRELRDRGINVTRKLLLELEDFIEGLQWFRIGETSTPNYAVLPPSFSGMLVIYVEGCEEEVARFLLQNLRCHTIRPLIALMRNWGAPDELRAAIRRVRRLQPPWRARERAERAPSDLAPDSWL